MQFAATRIAHWFGVRDFFIVRLASIRLTQIANAVRAAVGNNHILVRVSFLFTTVMQSLFFRVFRALTATFRPVNDVITRVPRMVFVRGKLVRVSFAPSRA